LQSFGEQHEVIASVQHSITRTIASRARNSHPLCHIIHSYAANVNTGQFLHNINVSMVSERRAGDTRRPVSMINDDTGRNFEDE
jgi:hypothetical protein